MELSKFLLYKLLHKVTTESIGVYNYIKNILTKLPTWNIFSENH